MKQFYYNAIRALIISLFLIYSPLGAEARTPAAGLREYRVIHVFDGDTVSIKASSFVGIPIRIERVRLIGIDAPELKQEPWGRQAKRQLKKLMSETDWMARVELDVEQRDKYGRVLAYLWSRDGRMINERMVETGYALPYPYPPNTKYAERFEAARARAEAGRAGLWARGGLRESPWEWRKRHHRD